MFVFSWTAMHGAELLSELFVLQSVQLYLIIEENGSIWYTWKHWKRLRGVETAHWSEMRRCCLLQNREEERICRGEWERELARDQRNESALAEKGAEGMFLDFFLCKGMTYGWGENAQHWGTAVALWNFGTSTGAPVNQYCISLISMTKVTEIFHKNQEPEAS